MQRLRNVSPLGAIDIPVLGREGDAAVAAGEVVTVSDDVAGEVPGTWRPPTGAEAAEGLRGLVTRVLDEGTATERTEVLCPGWGLLAQVGVWAPADTAPAPAPVTSPPAVVPIPAAAVVAPIVTVAPATATGQEG